MSDTNAFEVHLHGLLSRLRTDTGLPKEAMEMLERKIRQVHAENPALSPLDATKVANAILSGEGAEARMLAEHYEAEAEQARAAADRLRRRVASMDRIEAAGPELERLEHLYPGRTSMAEMLQDAGTTWEGVGLLEEDGAVLEEFLQESLAAAASTD
ncbi:hypothetical protein [Streptomyces xanthochromogenes]